jgi:hypothetical protein
MDLKEKIVAAQVKKGGLRGRINAFCCHCIYDPDGDGGNWRQQVTKCTSYHCPLYEVRPQSKPSKE